MAAPFVHLSVDDVVTSLQQLTESEPASVWEHPTFGLLRRLNFAYGATFSLYPFWSEGNWTMAQLPSRYAFELTAACTWLRWGFHGFDYGTDYGRVSATGEGVGGDGTASDASATAGGICGSGSELDMATASDAASDPNPAGATPAAGDPQPARDYKLTIDALCSFAGPRAIDRLPRVHFFAGSLGAVRAWRAASHGILGLLTPEDSRERVYYMTAPQRAELARGGYLHDPAERLHFVRSGIRLEDTVDVTAALALLSPSRIGTRSCFTMYTHEVHLSSPSMWAKIEEVCRWTQEQGLAWGFPAEALPGAGSAPSDARLPR